MVIFGALGKWSNLGLLIMRVGLGVMMVMHGYPKLLNGGYEKWASLGESVKYFGINNYWAAWGLAAAISETLGGILLVLGLFTRPACILLLGTMVVASVMHVKTGDGIMGASHAIELGFVFLGLLFVGPGKYSVDKA